MTASPRHVRKRDRPAYLRRRAPGCVKDHVKAAAKTVPGGYVVEAAIDLPTITLAPGTLLGFDVQVNDATGTARTSAVTWNDSTGRAYLDTSHWGVLRLARG
ncbi:sugar-binding protein [Nonomuraea sp. NPDC049400]|uniref:sugar-binding protein n=1 Tax=Nonomuraea sp. NPDC049400 TaxID=3364352 RepID=UPI0037AFFBF3